MVYVAKYKDQLFQSLPISQRGDIGIPKKDYAHFLQISFSSGTELETQIEICKRLQHGNIDDYVQVDALLIEIQKMLNVMTRKLHE